MKVQTKGQECMMPQEVKIESRTTLVSMSECLILEEKYKRIKLNLYIYINNRATEPILH